MEKSRKTELCRLIAEQAPMRGRIFRIISGMPRRYQEVISCRILRKMSWAQFEETHYYSERQGRNHLNEALEMLDRELRKGKKPG